MNIVVECRGMLFSRTNPILGISLRGKACGRIQHEGKKLVVHATLTFA